jgi:hypothetical protein
MDHGSHAHAAACGMEMEMAMAMRGFMLYARLGHIKRTMHGPE